MRVGLAIDERREAAALVNAVVGAYLDETVEAGAETAGPATGHARAASMSIRKRN